MDALRLKSGQRGASVWTIIVIVGVVGLFLTVAFRLAPAYLNNMAVQSVLKSIAAQPNIGNMTKLDVQKAIADQFQVNRVEAIKARCRTHDPSPCIRIERDKTTLTIDANYEVRMPLLANIDAVVKFEKNLVEIPVKGD